MSEEKQPLWLPKGSVRAIIALTSTSCAIVMVAKGINVPEWLATAIAMIWAYYFGARSTK